MNAKPDSLCPEGAYQAFLASPAQTTERGLADIEWDLQFGGLGMNRRAGLCMLLKSGKELTEMAEDRKGAFAIAASATAAVFAAERLRGLAACMDSSAMRSRLALCNRADMQDILAEAEATFIENGSGVASHAGGRHADR